MNDWELEPLVKYLEKNVGPYDLEALRERLLKSGYDPATVDGAIAAFRQQREGLVQSGGDPVPKPEASTGSTIGRVVLGIVLGILALIALLILVVGGLCILYFVGMNQEH